MAKMISQSSFIRGLNASTSVLNQPKGSVPRLTNFCLTKRGSFDTVDGSQIIDWYQGAVQTNRGLFEAITLFQPINVTRYYMSLNQVLDIPLNAPLNLVAANGGAGGTLGAGTYFYVVTATDGIGGETTVSNEVSITIGANTKVNLTWDKVQNAASYNVYRGTSSGAESLLIGTGLPTTTNSYTDNGASTVAAATANILASPNGIFLVALNPASGTPSGPHLVFINVHLSSPLQFGPKVHFTIAGSSMVFDPVHNIDGSYVSAADTPAGPTTTISFRRIYSGRQPNTGGGGTVAITVGPPSANTSTQVALFKYPTSTMTPISYDNSNIVALFPASVRIALGGTSGGSGGSGTSGSGGIGGFGTGGQGATSCGGILGMTGPLPQFAQFNNQLIIALGNGFPPQIYTDVGSIPSNAPYVVVSTIVNIVENAAGTAATVTTVAPHKLIVGANVLLNGNTVPAFNSSATQPAFVVLNVGSPTIFTVGIQTVGGTTGTGGTVTPTTFPMFNTFVPAYEGWIASTPYSFNSIVVPSSSPWQAGTVYNAGDAVIASPDVGFYFVASNAGTSGSTQPAFAGPIGNTFSDNGITWTTTGSTNFFYKATQGGTSGRIIPAFPQTVGATISDGSVIWQNGGTLASSAPAPVGAAQLAVYAGSLWIGNTYPNDNPNGLDGPTSLRMSDISNPTIWNPINQAFLDKDDGTQITGIAVFTITAQGIPPEGSLVVYKDYSTFQIAGVFGAQNFAIQRIKSDMGSVAPRSSNFIPGFGIGRLSHLGISIFDGVDDHVVSEEVRPYLFPSNEQDEQDITPMDQNFAYTAQGFQTAQPPMYCVAIPVGDSGGQLTRLLCHDLVLKGWLVVDLPFGITTATQVRAQGTNPLSIFGGFDDGVLQRWQAGDVQWYALSGGDEENVAWKVRTPEVTSQSSDERLFCRRLVIRGINSNSTDPLTVTFRVNGVPRIAINTPRLPLGDFDTFVTLATTSLRFSAEISGTGDVEILSFTWQVEPKPAGVPLSCG